MIELQNKRMLVTAGSTAAPIDKVRVVTNIFRGRTGEAIALAAARAGWQVILLSSAPVPQGGDPPLLTRVRYRTFDELAMHMELKITNGQFDAIVHSAAVSDYRLARVHTMTDDGRLEPLRASGSDAAKIPSSHERLFLEMVRTPKLVDFIRDPWGYKGKLVKFKLQADMSDDRLLDVARRSLAQSKADLIVANCLEWSNEYAYVVDASGAAEKVERPQLAAVLLRRLS